MNTSMVIKEVIVFKADKKAVWNLITNPKMTKKYMFGCEVLSDWKIGSQIIWKGKTENNNEIIYVKGTILNYVENQKLTFTMFDPNIGISDIPSNYIQLDYEILNNKEGTILNITQGDFYGTENAEKRFKESKQGWKMVIPTMKILLND